MKSFIILLSVFLYSGNCISQKTMFPYDLNKPDVKLELPFILNEVSGLTDIDTEHVACVQDELGIVFIYNFKTGRIVKQHRFDDAGDFEGLTYTGNSLFILRSDGRLTEWSDFKAKVHSGKIMHYKLPLQTSNNEGLCYDAENNRLLIAAKSKPFDHDSKFERFIYEFNLSSKTLNKKPVYSLNTESLAERAKAFHIDSREQTPGGRLRPFNFRPASIAVHPQTNKIYVISASDHLILVMNSFGVVEYMEKLNPLLFAKAEGITFLKDGTMIITNEAAGRVPTLLLFEKKSKSEEAKRF